MLAGAGLAVDRVDALARQLSARRTLKERFPDLGRHFIFEYYPWYGAAPFRHWDQDAHRPPADLAANPAYRSMFLAEARVASVR